jgi:hypothetical protein
MIKDLLDKFKSVWTPAQILTNEISGVMEPQDSQSDIDDLAIAEALVNHLNTILDYKDRMASLEYLSNQAMANFDNITYTTTSESLVNSIAMIGGQDGIVDFQLARTAIELVLEWIDLQAADSVAASYNGKF